MIDRIGLLGAHDRLVLERCQDLLFHFFGSPALVLVEELDSLSRSMRLPMSLRMCLWSKPRVCPAHGERHPEFGSDIFHREAVEVHGRLILGDLFFPGSRYRHTTSSSLSSGSSSRAMRTFRRRRSRQISRWLFCPRHSCAAECAFAVTLRAVHEREAQLPLLDRPLAPCHHGDAPLATSPPGRRAFDRCAAQPRWPG